MDIGRLRTRAEVWNATQTSNDADGYYERANPPSVWIGIEPLNPTTGDTSRTLGSVVTLRYHAQVGIDTKFRIGTRELLVRGVQNVDDRRAELRCYCEEVV